jgi:hypothetical protein
MVSVASRVCERLRPRLAKFPETSEVLRVAAPRPSRASEATAAHFAMLTSRTKAKVIGRRLVSV